MQHYCGAFPCHSELCYCRGYDATLCKQLSTADMNARTEEAKTISRCVDAAMGLALPADDREANVFRMASMILLPRYPSESNNLRIIYENYFAMHPSELIESSQVVRNGWVASPSRFRDMLEHALVQAHKGGK